MHQRGNCFLFLCVGAGRGGGGACRVVLNLMLFHLFSRTFLVEHGCGSKLNNQRTADVRSYCHLPGLYFGYLFLTRIFSNLFPSLSTVYSLRPMNLEARKGAQREGDDFLSLTVCSGESQILG